MRASLKGGQDDSEKCLMVAHDYHLQISLLVSLVNGTSAVVSGIELAGVHCRVKPLCK